MAWHRPPTDISIRLESGVLHLRATLASPWQLHQLDRALALTLALMEVLQDREPIAEPPEESAGSPADA